MEKYCNSDGRNIARSEEHTSELQSQSNLVCRLLLEKKKNTPLNFAHCSPRYCSFQRSHLVHVRPRCAGGPSLNRTLAAVLFPLRVSLFGECPSSPM